jgi:hypothetical protein
LSRVFRFQKLAGFGNPGLPTQRFHSKEAFTDFDSPNSIEQDEFSELSNNREEPNRMDAVTLPKLAVERCEIPES